MLQSQYALRYPVRRFATHCLIALLLWTLLSGIASAQDPRGQIAGKVTDPQGGLVPAASVVVTNTDTGVHFPAQSNSTGYFEVNLLNPGTYSVSVEAAGFKKMVRKGLELNVASRLDVDCRLEIGQIAETVEVTAAAPLLETTSASGGRVINNREVMQLPFSDLNPFTLTALAAGMQWTGRPEYRRPFDNGGTSSFNTAGAVGQNEYMVDGAPVNGYNRQVGYVPPADSVEEFKLETTSFDASIGHTTGAAVNLGTRSGTNTFHGSLFDQHWQQRWNALGSFTRTAWEDRVRRGLANPDDPRQPAGRSNNFGGAFGGPVRLPKIIDGRDKLFFFVAYNGIYQRAVQTANVNVPALSWRQGDFSGLQAVDATKYTIYDPRSARKEGSRVARTPFPGNKGIPVLNPMYAAYVKMYPTPNDVPGLVTRDSLNNYFPDGVRTVEDFNSVVNRVDYNISPKQRIFGRWYRNQRWNGNGDWTYSTVPGLQAGGGVRNNKGAGASYVLTISNTTVMDLGVSFNRYTHGNRRPAQAAFKPSDVGLPTYLDQKAGNLTSLPELTFSSINTLSQSYPAAASVARAGTGEAKATFISMKGKHSLKYGWQERRYWYPFGDPGYTSGQFGFDNTYMRANDATTTASNTGLEWAAFMMGLPNNVRVDTNTDAFWSTRYRALFVHDDWRLTGKLHLTLGLRYEREGGISERYNRGLSGEWNPGDKLPFSDAALAAYAKSPLAEVAAAQFNAGGGIRYLGAEHKGFTDGTHKFLPRIGVAYEVTPKLVLRGGYGLYYDTFNNNNFRPSQFGFSVTTRTTVSNDLGLTFCCGVGDVAGLTASRNVLTNPFPVRADGSRFDTPYGNSLANAALAGGSYASYPRGFEPDRQQRWRLSVSRQFGSNIAVEVAYNGARANIWAPHNLNALPAQYWATGSSYNSAVDSELNRNVANPFYIGNLTSLQTSNPTLYRYLSTQSFFTSTTIRKNRLLRPFPVMNSLTGLPGNMSFNDSRGVNKYHDLVVQVERRFGKGFQTAVLYTRAYGMVQDLYANEFDAMPSWESNNNVRPHRFVWSAIYELPFGKGKATLTKGPLQHVAGGWQLSWIYQIQSGPLVNLSNRFFYGTPDQVNALLNHDQVHGQDIRLWFDPNIAYKASGAVPSGFVGIEGRSAAQPGAFQVRMSPFQLSGLRADGIRNWDVKLLRRFRIHERLNTNISADLLNATNHTNFSAPVVDPTSTNFGRVTSQNGLGRIIQLNLRLEF